VASDIACAASDQNSLHGLCSLSVGRILAWFCAGVPAGNSFGNGKSQGLACRTAVPAGNSFGNGKSQGLACRTAVSAGNSFGNGKSQGLACRTAVPAGMIFEVDVSFPRTARSYMFLRRAQSYKFEVACRTAVSAGNSFGNGKLFLRRAQSYGWILGGRWLWAMGV